jgi:NitT/TauT family transport system permease protein
MNRALAQRLESFGPALVVGAAVFGVWELAVRALDIKEFLLPRPTSILGALRQGWNSSEGGTLGTVSLREAGFNTSMIAISGLVMGVVLGVLLALVITRFTNLGSAVTPLAVAVNATPIVALAPIFNAWFGLTSNASNQAVVIAVVFFPVFVNAAKGLTEVHPNQLELMRSYGASELTILRRVRIPNALPFFFTSLRIAAPLSVIAAIVAEYFGGPLSRLGPVITQNASFARYDVAWAAIVVASAVGLGLFVLAVVAEKAAMPWKRPEERP